MTLWNLCQSSESLGPFSRGANERGRRGGRRRKAERVCFKCGAPEGGLIACVSGLSGAAGVEFGRSFQPL